MRNRQQYSRAAAWTAASLGGLSLATVTVQAQEAEVVEEVVVTGFRASLADALENKRESNQIIESIAAEDIGKFPDQNVAEALQRLSGVQIDRSNGQGTKVRIRGLDQNVTLLNSDIFLQAWSCTPRARATSARPTRSKAFLRSCSAVSMCINRRMRRSSRVGSVASSI